MRVYIVGRLKLEDEEVDIEVSGDYVPYVTNPADAYIKTRDEILKSKKAKEEK